MNVYEKQITVEGLDLLSAPLLFKSAKVDWMGKLDLFDKVRLIFIFLPSKILDLIRCLYPQLPLTLVGIVGAR